MMIVKGFIRKYVGSFLREEDAARLYDMYAICLWGRQARTNFAYTQSQILQLLKEYEKDDKSRKGP